MNKEKFKNVVYFIEANSFEASELWERYHKKLEWVEDNIGLFETIGCINNDKDMPVCVTFSFSKIYGKKICFYETVSRFIDYKMVENYLKKKL